MRHWTDSALVQVIAWGLFNADSLLEPMPNYYQVHQETYISVRFEEKYNTFIWRKAFENVART